MRKAIIDLNIIIDFLNKRDDHISAAKIIDLVNRKLLKGYLCSHEITTLSYFLEKNKYKKDQRILIINKLLDTFSVISCRESILRKALFSHISDYEDAVIVESAISEKIDFIITRNLKDFSKSSIQIVTASEAISIIGSIEVDV